MASATVASPRAGLSSIALLQAPAPTPGQGGRFTITDLPVHDSDPGVHDADLGVHDPDPAVQDDPGLLFTMDRSKCSRWSETRSRAPSAFRARIGVRSFALRLA